VAFAPYGEHWRQARKIITGHLLSAKKVASLCAAREEEARLVVAKLREARGPVDLSGMLFAFSNDIVCRAMSGKFFRAEGRNDVFRELIHMNVAALGGFNLENYFPSLGNISMLRRPVLGKLERLKKRWHDLLDQIIDEHDASNSSSLDQDQERDFVGALLSLQHDYDLTREHIKTILMVRQLSIIIHSQALAYVFRDRSYIFSVLAKLLKLPLTILVISLLGNPFSVAHHRFFFNF
jgi:cytochrome P450